MNTWIVLLFILTGISNPMIVLGWITGLAICYLMIDKKNKESSIYKRFTKWSWWDIRV